MTNHWDQHDHDPISHVTVVADRPTISLRHMSMSGGGSPTAPPAASSTTSNRPTWR